MTKSFTTITIAFLLLSVYILLGSTLDARGTDVTSDITGNTIWTIAGSPYIVKQNVSVTGGSTLTIQSGVVVKFSGYLSLSISGALVVSGTPAGRVIFTYDSSTPTAGSWEGIRFLAGSDDSGSSLTSADILYASNGLYLDHSSPAIDDVEVSSSLRKGINILQSSPLINNCRIKNGLGTGIKSVGGYPTIQDSEVSGHANGLELIDSDAAIKRNLIKSNGIGLLLNSSSPSIVDNDFTLNKEGIQADFNSHPSLEGNAFNTNSKTGLWVLDGSSATLLEDDFVGNGVAIEIEDSEVTVEQISVISGRISMQLEEGSRANIWNSSLLASDEFSLYLEQTSTAVLTNTDFNAALIHIESGCSVYVRNYLTVSVVDSNEMPVEDASVNVQDDGVTIASLTTNSLGLSDDLVVLDIVHFADGITENHKTAVDVDYPEKQFEVNPREVDMSTSHTEIFREKAYEAPDGNESSYWLLASIVILVVASLLVVLLMLRKRKREEVAGEAEKKRRRRSRRRR